MIDIQSKQIIIDYAINVPMKGLTQRIHINGDMKPSTLNTHQMDVFTGMGNASIAGDHILHSIYQMLSRNDDNLNCPNCPRSL